MRAPRSPPSRTLGLYLQHDALPSAATIARYDVVVIDAVVHLDGVAVIGPAGAAR